MIQSQISLLFCTFLGNGLFNDTESDIIIPMYIFREWIIQ